MCTVLLPPGVNPTAVNKYIISYQSYHIISYHIYHIISYRIISYHIILYHIISYHISYRIASHHITSHHITSYHISYHISSHHIIYILSYHNISYQSYHIIILFSLMPTPSCLRLLPRILFPLFYPPTTFFRMQFLRTMSPIQLAFSILHFVCRSSPPWLHVTLSFLTRSVQIIYPSFSSTTF